MTQIWPKRAIFEFSQKTRKRHFFQLQRLGLVQKIANSNERIAEKKWKTSIFGHFGPKWQIFDSFWPKWAKREFFKKAIGTFLSRLQGQTNGKVSEKSNERFSSNHVTDVHTDVRTDSCESLCQRLRRETKNSHCYFDVMVNHLGCNCNWYSIETLYNYPCVL